MLKSPQNAGFLLREKFSAQKAASVLVCRDGLLI
jgi:hypothetical protein